ncbi:hypothetical protein QQP08_003751 [Theobroma cacao]|nr:hypothetical protein QQP08_003751 [Theobroma cacao]
MVPLDKITDVKAKSQMPECSVSRAPPAKPLIRTPRTLPLVWQHANLGCLVWPSLSLNRGNQYSNRKAQCNKETSRKIGFCIYTQ